MQFAYVIISLILIIAGGIVFIGEYDRHQVAKWRKECEEERKQRENDPGYILRRWYNAKTKEHKKSKWQNIKRCIDSDAEFRQSLEYLRSLESFNGASYLGYVEDAILATTVRTNLNLKHIVNYLIIDGCIDNIKKESVQRSYEEDRYSDRAE